jgi:tRNA(Leu) C34 or U34 (ribose-2'-O)-methylase TrmL
MIYISYLLNLILLPFLVNYIVVNQKYIKKRWYPLMLEFDTKLRKYIKYNLKMLEPLKQQRDISEKVNPFYEEFLTSNNIGYDNIDVLFKHQKKLNLNYDMMVLNLNSNLNTGTIYRTGCLLGMDNFIIAGKKVYNVRSMVGYKFCPINYLDIFPQLRNRMKPETLSNFNKKAFGDFLLKNDYNIFIIEQGGCNILDEKIKNKITNNIFNKKKILYIMGNETHGVPKNMINMLVKEFKATVVSLPQWGCAHSFNVSQAANIVMWNHYSNFLSKERLKF